MNMDTMLVNILIYILNKTVVLSHVETIDLDIRCDLKRTYLGEVDE